MLRIVLLLLLNMQGVCVSTATQPSGDEAAVYHKVTSIQQLLLLLQLTLLASL
jgi:hypothetical protein